MDIIQSRENSLIKHVRKLKEKKYRVQHESFIVEGFRFVEEAVKSDFETEYIFIANEAVESKYTHQIMSIIKSETKIYTVSNTIMKDICSTENPQGIAAVVKIKKQNALEGDGFYVLVDRIQDPGNFGTIIRTAHAGGAQGVLYTRGTVDLYNEKTLRSTMGSIFHIPLMEDTDLNLLNTLKERGFKVVVSSLDTQNNFYDVDLSSKVIICVGNEGNGISQEVYSLADEKVKIPMPGGAESLNASVATSIMIFEAVRQKLLK